MSHCDDNNDNSIDEEIKEAMRQSLLEHKRQETLTGAVKHDKDVDILITHSEEKERHYLQYFPEPYLRQMINTLVKEDKSSKNDEQDVKVYYGKNKELPNFNFGNIDLSHKTLKSKISGATFISNVLDKMQICINLNLLRMLVSPLRHSNTP